MANTEQRWRFVRDDDAHNYLIPAEELERFNKWDWEIDEGEGFEKYRIDSPSGYTFADPKQD